MALNKCHAVYFLKEEKLETPRKQKVSPEGPTSFVNG